MRRAVRACVARVIPFVMVFDDDASKVLGFVSSLDPRGMT